MRRRDLILAGAASCVVTAAGSIGQARVLPLVGFLRTTTREASAHLVSAFQRGLAEGGFAADTAYRLLLRFADGNPRILPGLARELVAAEPSILIGNSLAARALQAETTRIAIVFVTGSDPERIGLVSSINRPGGNVTGVTLDPAVGTLEPKRLEMLHTLVPGYGRLAVLSDPSNPTALLRNAELKKAAGVLGRDIVFASATSPDEIAAGFRSFVQRDVKGMLVSAGPHFIEHRQFLSRLASENRLPCIYVLREFAMAGGLMSYGTSQPGAYEQAGRYAARILRGTPPSELPVMQASKFELVLNLKTAKMLGIEIPSTLLAIADEVIE